MYAEKDKDMIEQGDFGCTKRVVARAWEYVRKDIEATAQDASGKEMTFLDHLQRAFDKAFATVMEAVEAGRTDTFANLVSTRYGPELGETELHELNRPVRVGFLALAANPLWWGHILVALMSQGVCELDTVVFRVQGKIQYKDVFESDRVSVRVRHELAKRVLAKFYPLLRYTDLGSEPGNKREGAEETHRYFALNRDRALHLFYLLGVESRERVREYFMQHYEAAKQHDFGRNPKHRLTIGWIQRGDYGAQITDTELEALSARAQRAVGHPSSIPSVLIQDPYIDLDVSSTYYRDTHDATIVPGVVDAYAESHRLYGYS
jgi:hypothetical protein